MKALHARGIACAYLTVRAIVAGKQDGGRTRHTERITRSRFAHPPLGPKMAHLPAIDHEAMRTLRTLYRSSVREVDDATIVLKSGEHQGKIGKYVLKGRWKHMPIYTLTLEERATCPISCRHLRSCYGNNMPFSLRWVHDPAFERRLVENVVALARSFPSGFVVRAHILGDFYSTDYVRLWQAMIEIVPALNVFGYTARWDDDIGAALRALVALHPARFAIRFSNAPTAVNSTISIELPVQKPADTVICPAQQGRTESCATCALCWATTKRIAFLQH